MQIKNPFIFEWVFVFTGQEIRGYLCTEVENFHEEKNEQKNSYQTAFFDLLKYDILFDSTCKSKDLNGEHCEVQYLYIWEKALRILSLRPIPKQIRKIGSSNLLWR